MQTITEKQAKDIKELELQLTLVYERKLTSFEIIHPVEGPGFQVSNEFDMIQNAVLSVVLDTPGNWELLTKRWITNTSSARRTLDTDIVYISFHRGCPDLKAVATELVLKSGVSCTNKYDLTSESLQSPSPFDGANEKVQHLWKQYRKKVGENTATAKGFTQWLFSIKIPEECENGAGGTNVKFPYRYAESISDKPCIDINFSAPSEEELAALEGRMENEE